MYTGQGEKKNKKRKKNEYATKDEQIMKAMGLLPPDEDDEMEIEPNRFIWLGGTGGPGVPGYTGQQIGQTGLPMGQTPLPYMHNTPRVLQNYAPLRQGDQKVPEYTPGNLEGRMQGQVSQININYTAPDGMMYQISVAAPAEKRDQAAYNVLTGLYAVMMAEGVSGKYGRKGSGSTGKGGLPTPGYLGKGGTYGGGKSSGK